MPSSRNSKWLINSSLKYAYGLEACLGYQNIEEVSNVFVDEANLQVFIVPEIKQMTKEVTSVEQEIKNLKDKIEYFLSLHMMLSTNDEKQLCDMFVDTPNELERLLVKIKYNVVSVGEATEIYRNIKKQWDNK